MKKTHIKFLSLIVLLVIASLNYVFLLRHKIPYVSDSYFYTHIYYRIQGYSFDESYNKVINNVDPSRLSNIEKNFLYDKAKYKYSLSRYIRRPLYPLSAFIINLVIHNEYLSFLIPVFISYLGVVILIYYLFFYKLSAYWASFGTALFIGFYPYLDWSTYFLTDTIGAFFWLTQVYLILKYIQDPKKILLLAYSLSLIISLLNREQSLVMFITIALMIVFGKLFGLNNKIKLSLKKLFLVSIIISFLYLLLNALLKQPTIYDSWIYLESNFGFSSKYYSFGETLKFIFSQIFILHKGLIIDIARHRWWLVITLLGFVGIWKVFIKERRPKFIDLLLLASGISAYIGLIIIPYLSYRYFYPSIIGIIYFSMNILIDLNRKSKK